MLEFQARRKREETVTKDDKQELNLATGSPSRDSVGTSIEVHTGNSIEVLSVGKENVAVQYRMPKKARTQVFRLKVTAVYYTQKMKNDFLVMVKTLA